MESWTPTIQLITAIVGLVTASGLAVRFGPSLIFFLLPRNRRIRILANEVRKLAELQTALREYDSGSFCEDDLEQSTEVRENQRKLEEALSRQSSSLLERCGTVSTEPQDSPLYNVVRIFAYLFFLLITYLSIVSIIDMARERSFSPIGIIMIILMEICTFLFVIVSHQKFNENQVIVSTNPFK